ncbi:translation initiation factor IF-2 [Frateuria aurantia]|uniref:Translation initiation factor IF-2 n=1 Tax=Frateuria aurantia (strain ATCC 33424 / DSM 6220 / KCTC 2777 / LMG 1558 / NBRC 3245 / NCIMB 13370) TaxID=767434 RepID=H8L3B6_FRAAD|nr:translation initiation factor IF-2 [Frateuria aurantia]AFC85552.1 translation initiation factor IF-2 [Frateuria aurantia DSM 6220]
MSDVTIKQLAQVLGMPVTKLLSQLGEAGMQFSDPEQIISSTEKVKLLGFLRRSHGKGEAVAEPADTSPRQITLKRRKVSELTVAAPGGRGASSAKTVNVEVRAKRTYVKRSALNEDAQGVDESQDEISQQALESQQAQAEQERIEAEQRKAAEAAAREEAARQQAEREAAEAEARARAEAEERARAEQAEREAAEARAEAERASVAEKKNTEDKREESVPVVQKIDPSALGMIVPRIHEPRRREKPVAKPAAPAAKPAPVVKPAAPAASGNAAGNGPRGAAGTSNGSRAGAGGRGRDEGGQGKRFAGGELHLSDADRARRSSNARRGKPGKGGRDFGRNSSAPSQTGPHGFSRPTAPVVREVAISDSNTVSDLAQKMAVKGAEVVKALFKMGVMATINQAIDHDTAVLVVEELGHTPVEASENNAEAALAAHTQNAELEGEKTPRPPVVTIMGHVDHGKTSLLDYIRRTKVASGEAGGITQHIGAYHVNTPKGVITFLDTPGHAAFTSMRARGAQSTDIVVLVVASDDGVMPQTAEAVQHARAAKVPLIVALNKMDKPDANPDHVKQGLGNLEVIPEEWGGDTPFIPVSAKTGLGIDDLLDAISVQAEVMELTAVEDGAASGVVIESSLDRGRGPVATVLVQQGTLKRGDFVVCGIEYGRMRALVDETGKTVQEAGPSIPVQVLGLSGVPEAGDDFVVVADERLAREVAAERQQKRRDSRMVSKANRLEDIMAQMGQGAEMQTLNILVKADVQGSVQALRESLSQIGNENVKVNVIASGVGGITESDATLAAASKALVIGFNVRADASARKVIDTSGLDVRYFSIIYDVIDQVKQAASGLLGVEIREEIIGIAEVREVFRSSKFGAVAGSMVVEGTVKRNKPIRVLRNNTVVFQGELESLRRFKELVDEVRNGMECGIAVKQYNDVKVGDQIECFERIEVARTL